MSDDAVDLAIIGEPTALVVETEQAIEPQVQVVFQATLDGQPAAVSWVESLTVTTHLAPEPGAKRVRNLITWAARWPGTPAQLEKGPLLRVTITGKKAGSPSEVVAATSRNMVALRPPIEVTAKPELTRIMLHEFATANGAFDPGPLKELLKKLTVQQKKLLLDYKVGSSGHQLVVFITQHEKPETPRLMGGDYTTSTREAVSNATFSVFHCRGPGKVVTLVCHTAYFVINYNNGDTQTFMAGPQGGVPAAKWQRKDSTAPPKFKIAAMPPNEHFMRGQVLHRIFTANGKDIMKGNTLHGLINTNGCWMLFRNFNWPRSKFAKFDEIYRTIFRPMREAPNWSVLKKKLSALGYDKEADDDKRLSSSLEKFMNYDRNYAYLWFLHDLVGIKYFSSSFLGWGYFPRQKATAESNVTFVNDYKPHGLVEEAQFPYAEENRPLPNNLPDEGNNAYYDSEVRRAVEKGYQVTNALWRRNVLGFQTTDQFVPTYNKGGERYGEHPAAVVEASAWADLYIFSDPAPLP